MTRLYYRRLSFTKAVVCRYRKVKPVALIFHTTELVFSFIAVYSNCMVDCFTTTVVTQGNCVASDRKARPAKRFGPAQDEYKGVIVR